MASAEEALAVKVQVSYSPAPRQVDQVEVDLPPGSQVTDALLASGLLERHGLGAAVGLSVGIWGKARPLDTPVHEADRIEIYRGLTVDPKEARRQRYRKHKR